MARDHLDNCPRCSADLMFDGSSTLVKCKSCGETIKVADFLNEEIRLEQAQQEAAEAQKALEAAQQEKAAAVEEKKEAEQRVFRAITQLEDISISQSEQKESLEKLLSGQEASKTEAKALHQLLDALYGQQETHQDALTELLSAVLQGQETTDDKLKVLQEISEKLLQSQNDIISLAGYLKTDTRETNRLIGQMFSWSQNTNQETTRRLKAMQSGSEALQNSLKDIDKKIDRLDSSIANVSSQITDFESSWKESELKKITSLYHQAENKQKSRDFDKAEGYYRNVLTSGGEDPEVYWRLILCHYCVEYQQDDHGKWLPTILYPSLDEPRTLPEWEDLQKKCADSPELLKHYEKLLTPIEQIIQRYCQLRQTVTPQVFICVKQEENDLWTTDSNTASDLYDLIRGKGLSVFNSKRTQIPAGEMYEPYIIAALLSARLMIVVGTTPDHMEARWVKNEWTRFQWLQDKEIKGTGKTDRRLVCYLKGMKPKDIPGGLHPDIQAIVEGTTSTKALEKLLKQTFPGITIVEESFELIRDQMENWLAIDAFEKVNQKYIDLVDLNKYINEPRLYLYGLCAKKEVSSFEQLAALEIYLEKEKLFMRAREKAVKEEDKKLIGELLRINTEHNLPPSPPPKPESDKVRQLRIKAENGDIVSQLQLAHCCETGDGTEQSFSEAFRWYRNAAEANNASAQCCLGYCYCSGQGVKQDSDKAISWFQKSADQGDAYGQAFLGIMYEISRNYLKAAEWHQKSADQNHSGAQRNLGRLYEKGLGVEQDYEKAALWYRKAADQGDEKAQTSLIDLEKKIKELKQKSPVIQPLEIDSKERKAQLAINTTQAQNTSSDNRITEPLPKPSTGVSPAIGSIITFGAYPQTSAGTDQTPIEWIVLDIQDRKALLLSKFGLDAKPYNKEFIETTWETCTLRRWLNNDFLKKAFSEKEQSAILITDVDNSNKSGYVGWQTPSGNNTQDQIFLLSCAEANKYLDVIIGAKKMKSRVSPTDYAKIQGASTAGFFKTEDGNRAGWWWLRSPGYDQDVAAVVNRAGFLDLYDVNYGDGVVRPALWISLESDIF